MSTQNLTYYVDMMFKFRSKIGKFDPSFTINYESHNHFWRVVMILHLGCLIGRLFTPQIPILAIFTLPGVAKLQRPKIRSKYYTNNMRGHRITRYGYLTLNLPI